VRELTEIFHTHTLSLSQRTPEVTLGIDMYKISMCLLMQVIASMQSQPSPSPPPAGVTMDLANGTASRKYWLAHPVAGEASFDTLKDRQTIYTGDKQNWPWYDFSSSLPPPSSCTLLPTTDKSDKTTLNGSPPLSQAGEWTTLLGWFEQTRTSNGIRGALPIRVSVYSY
jgi:hypothetical protein